MSRCNPLLAEALRGLAGSGPAQLAYLGYLAIQGTVLFLWWPKSELYRALASERGPDTLLAVVVTVGVTVAYYNLRTGAEEVLLPGQQSLREWALATPLAPMRVLRGYAGGHLLQTLHAILLSSPLILMAFSVAGGEWPALAWSLTAVLFQATFYRFAGAVMYLAIGHYGGMMFFSVRAALVLAYALTAALIPVASHPVMSYRLLNGSSATNAGGATVPDHIVFLLIYAFSSMLLAIVLHRLLSRDSGAVHVMQEGRP